MLCAGIASATVTTSSFVANGTSTGGDAVDAQAVFSFNNMNDELTVTLTNLLANPTSVAQNITDFDFQIQTNSKTALACNSNCLMSATTLMGTVTVNTGGSVAHGGNVNPAWAVTGGTGGFVMNGLGGTSNPALSIIGPPGSGGYTNANGSLTNGSHNPMINQSAKWTFLLAGLTNGTMLTAVPTHVVFSFGTTVGDLFSCDSSSNDCGGSGQSTPEPWTFVLAGTGLVGIYFIRRRKPGSR